MHAADSSVTTGKQTATSSTERTAATALPQVSVQGIRPVPNNLADVPTDIDIPTTWKFDYDQTFTMFRPVTPEIENKTQKRNLGGVPRVRRDKHSQVSSRRSRAQDLKLPSPSRNQTCGLVERYPPR